METSRCNGIPYTPYPVNIHQQECFLLSPLLPFLPLHPLGPTSPPFPIAPPYPLLPLSPSPSQTCSDMRRPTDKVYWPSRMSVCSLSNSTSQPPSILCSTFRTCRMFSDIHTSSVTVWGRKEGESNRSFVVSQINCHCYSLSRQCGCTTRGCVRILSEIPFLLKIHPYL